MKPTDLIWFFARILIGLVLAYAGFTKLTQPIENFRGMILQYQVIPYDMVSWIAWILPWFEFIFGVFMILGYAPRLTSRVCALLFAGFLVVVGSSSALLEGAKDCGCFGEGSPIHLSVRQVFALDFISLLICLKLASLKEHFLSLDSLLRKG